MPRRPRPPHAGGRCPAAAPAVIAAAPAWCAAAAGASAAWEKARRSAQAARALSAMLPLGSLLLLLLPPTAATAPSSSWAGWQQAAAGGEQRYAAAAANVLLCGWKEEEEEAGWRVGGREGRRGEEGQWSHVGAVPPGSRGRKKESLPSSPGCARQASLPPTLQEREGERRGGQLPTSFPGSGGGMLWRLPPLLLLLLLCLPAAAARRRTKASSPSQPASQPGDGVCLPGVPARQRQGAARSRSRRGGRQQRSPGLLLSTQLALQIQWASARLRVPGLRLRACSLSPPHCQAHRPAWGGGSTGQTHPPTRPPLPLSSVQTGRPELPMQLEAEISNRRRKKPGPPGEKNGPEAGEGSGAKPPRCQPLGRATGRGTLPLPEAF